MASHDGVDARDLRCRESGAFRTGVAAMQPHLADFDLRTMDEMVVPAT